MDDWFGECSMCNVPLFPEEKELGICDLCVEELEQKASKFEHASGKE